MELLNVFLASLGSIVVLFLMTKLMGNKQLSQLNMFDYINGITIGSIAAEMATSLENDFLKPLLAMLVYSLAAFCISIVSCKSLKLRKIFTGRPLIIFEKGKLYEKNLFKAKLDINEFLMLCRINGYFNLADLELAMLEPNGRFSFLPKAEKRPAIPEDFMIQPKQEQVLFNVVLDGKILPKNLRYSGNNETWLKDQLKMQGFRIKDISLATCDSENELSVYKKIGNDNTRDVFE